jgi:hypothetical protein
LREPPGGFAPIVQKNPASIAGGFLVSFTNGLQIGEKLPFNILNLLLFFGMRVVSNPTLSARKFRKLNFKVGYWQLAGGSEKGTGIFKNQAKSGTILQ